MKQALARLRLTLLLAAAAACIPRPAEAGDEESVFGLSGFGTAGAVYNNRPGTVFRRDIAQSDGARGDSLSFAPDSMLGVQMTARPNAYLESAAQVLSRNDIDGGFRPRVTWAYLKYRPSESTSLRVGRLGIELYIQGDSVDIGYANLTVRPPIVFYPRSHDGIDAETTALFGSGTLRAKGFAGFAGGEVSSGQATYKISGAPLIGALADYVAGGWTVRLAGGRLTMRGQASDASANALATALAGAPNGAQIVAAISLKDRRIDYLSTALAYDAGPLQSVTSYALVSTGGWSDLHSLYATAGYRLGHFTPYGAYYQTWTGRGTVPTGIPAGLSPATDALNQAAALAQSAGSKVNQRGLAIGVRFDLTAAAAIKLQLDHLRYLDPESIIDPSLAVEPYAARRARTLELLSATLDFVF